MGDRQPLSRPEQLDGLDDAELVEGYLETLLNDRHQPRDRRGCGMSATIMICALSIATNSYSLIPVKVPLDHCVSVSPCEMRGGKLMPSQTFDNRQTQFICAIKPGETVRWYWPGTRP